MLFLNNELINNSIELDKVIEKEKDCLKLFIESHQKQKSLLLSYMQQFASSTENIDVKYLETVLKFLEDVKVSFNLINKNISLLNDLLEKITDIELKIKNNTFELNNANLSGFNTNFLDTTQTILEGFLETQNFLQSVSEYSQLKFIENNAIVEIPKNTEKEYQSETCETSESISESIQQSSSNDLEELFKNKKMKNEELSHTEQVIEHTEKCTILDNTLDDKYQENTLIISELKGKVILPYTLNEINNLISKEHNEFINVDDVIDMHYTLPIDLFKNASVSRFKEAFKLIKNKEKGSLKEAFDLGMELLFNSNLHPAIITACKNLDELDIYLDYLENDESDKFDIFKIVFEIAPVIKSKS